mgnify:CR=1 FL=1
MLLKPQKPTQAKVRPHHCAILYRNAFIRLSIHFSAGRIAPFSSKIIPDSQSFQLRFQACTNAQEAKAIYHLLKRYKNSTNFPGDIKLDLETCKTVRSSYDLWLICLLYINLLTLC